MRCARAAGAAIFVVLTAAASAQSPPPAPASTSCSGERFREFDFWRGDWDVAQRIRDREGGWLTFPARTLVSASPDGCVVTEHWSGQVQFFWEGMTQPEAMWGFSVRRFDPSAGTWSIFWMDRRRPEFGAPYVGRFEGGRGEFFRTVDTPSGSRRNRIVFERQGDGRVDWSLAVSADEGKTWTEVWVMEMTRR